MLKLWSLCLFLNNQIKKVPKKGTVGYRYWIPGSSTVSNVNGGKPSFQQHFPISVFDIKYKYWCIFHMYTSLFTLSYRYRIVFWERRGRWESDCIKPVQQIKVVEKDLFFFTGLWCFWPWTCHPVWQWHKYVHQDLA